jgi:GMP synthase (glutamine-hydrolysing)
VWAWTDPVTFLEGACGIILGGSTALFDGNLRKVAGDHNDALFAHDRMKELLHFISKHDVPTLGICFGHQLLAEYHGAPIMRDDAQAKIGTHAVVRAMDTDDDCLFSCLPETFNVQYIHKDAVTALPSGAQVVAHGSHCTYAALRYGKNRYTVQFHPEFDHHQMKRVATAHPDYVLDLSPVDSLVIEESPHAATILREFVARCASSDYNAA